MLKLKDSHKETLSLIGRLGAIAAAAFITFAVAGTSLVLGFTIDTFADTGTQICQELECKECLDLEYCIAACETCNPISGGGEKNNKGLKPEIIGIIGAVTALALGIPLIIFLAQRRKETLEILVKKEEY